MYGMIFADMEISCSATSDKLVTLFRLSTTTMSSLIHSPSSISIRRRQMKDLWNVGMMQLILPCYRPQWLSIRRFLIIEIATIRLLMQMNQLLIIERVLECFQRVGVDEVVLLWLLRIVTSGLLVGNVVGLGVLHWWALRIILRDVNGSETSELSERMEEKQITGLRRRRQ